MNWAELTMRQRDAFVAIHLFNWNTRGLSLPEATRMWDYQLPNFTTNMAHVWQVVNWIEKNNWDLVVSSNQESGEWSATIWIVPHQKACHQYASSAAEAICLAALKAGGIQVDS
ncbi:MAG: Phage sandwich domain [Bacilli bacterium]|nr:Phage sandwich domain [Bacilli bacterium]